MVSVDLMILALIDGPVMVMYCPEKGGELCR
jgi:hypothetical protein